MSKKDTKEKVLYRLEYNNYMKLEKELNTSPRVDENTSAHQAGFKLGVQYVLQKLRDGYVIQNENS